MTSKSISITVLATVALLAIMFFLGKCAGNKAKDEIAARAASDAKADSLVKSEAVAVGALSRLQAEKSKDSAIQRNTIDSVIVVQQFQRVGFSQQTAGIKQQLATLTAKLYSNPGDTAGSRQALMDLQDRLSNAAVTMGQIQTTSDQKDSFRVAYTQLLEKILDSTNRHADTLNRNFIGMQGLYAQLSLDTKPHTVVSAGFNVLTGGGLSAVGPSIQLQAKNGSSYQLSLDYTTQKTGLVQFTWLSKIKL
jgi:hypothetical protein